ncbi:MAG TPA: pyrroline-5-carboxylate reductase [Methylocella sp.]|nr:pyrroline-5-carboxylate reductase [Methylocella sp.]
MAAPAADPSGFKASLLLAGAGKMGGAMLRAWLDRGYDPGKINVIEPNPSQDLIRLARAKGFALGPPLRAPEILVLGMKPQTLDAAAASLAPFASAETLVVSILAGKTMANIAARLPQARAIIRAMPNLPAAVGRGATGLAANEAVTQHQRGLAEGLLAAVGRVEWLADEHLIDAVTAISGSGPAYVFYLAECLAKAGAALGLPENVAARLARATVEGAGELLFQSVQSTPAQLRAAVTSPGGTTAAALDVLMAPDGLAPLIERSAAAARLRATQLSG